MHTLNSGRQRRAVRTVLCLVGLLAALAVAGPFGGTASADCTAGGSNCLPGSGYTYEQVWSCTVLNENCNSSGAHSWGWGSASYSGSGSVYVCVQLGGYAVGCATNLARSCFSPSCNDQNIVNFNAYIQNQSGFRHTISGHAEA